jgi:hypothetical protein
MTSGRVDERRTAMLIFLNRAPVAQLDSVGLRTNQAKTISFFSDVAYGQNHSWLGEEWKISRSARSIGNR